jgi:hypothetical protein
MHRPTAPRGGAAPSLSTAKLESEQRHNRVLLHALQIGHPVTVDGVNQFIQCLSFNREGGGIDATVYLAGVRESVRGDQVALATNVYPFGKEAQPAAAPADEQERA